MIFAIEMQLTFSMYRPIPEAVIARPPNICVASSATSEHDLVMNLIIYLRSMRRL